MVDQSYGKGRSILLAHPYWALLLVILLIVVATWWYVLSYAVVRYLMNRKQKDELTIPQIAFITFFFTGLFVILLKISGVQPTALR